LKSTKEKPRKLSYGDLAKCSQSFNVFTKPANLALAVDIVEKLPAIDETILHSWLQEHQDKFSEEFPGKLFELVFDRNVRDDISQHDAHLIACCMNFVKEQSSIACTP